MRGHAQSFRSWLRRARHSGYGSPPLDRRHEIGYASHKRVRRAFEAQRTLTRDRLEKTHYSPCRAGPLLPLDTPGYAQYTARRDAASKSGCRIPGEYYDYRNGA
jgi:hypothetical protein